MARGKQQVKEIKALIIKSVIKTANHPLALDTNSNVQQNGEYVCCPDASSGGWWVQSKAMGIYINPCDVVEAIQIKVGSK